MRGRYFASLLVVAIVAFVIAFAGARWVSGDGSSDPASQPAPRSHAPVAIDNLERMPDIKPLRSAPGAPPTEDAAPSAPPAEAAGPGAAP